MARTCWTHFEFLGSHTFLPQQVTNGSRTEGFVSSTPRRGTQRVKRIANPDLRPVREMRATRDDTVLEHPTLTKRGETVHRNKSSCAINHRPRAGEEGCVSCGLPQ